MTNPAAARKLERVHGLLARSFVRYVVEAAEPEVLDPWDRKALEALKAWRASLLEALAGIEEVLLGEKVHPSPPAWPMEFSQYNYLKASYLLRVAIRKAGPELAHAEAEAEGLSLWPEASRPVGRALEAVRSHLAALEALEVQRPKDPPAPGAKKGVSASRW